MAEKNHIAGLSELDKVLGDLGPELAKRELAASGRAGAAVFRKEIIRNIPQGKGPLKKKYGRAKKNIRSSATETTPTGVQFVVHNGKAFWLLFREFGTAPHRIIPRKRSGHTALGPDGVFGAEVNHPGQAPDPVFTRAFESKKEDAVQKMGERLFKGVTKTAEELAGKYGSLRKSTRRRL